MRPSTRPLASWRALGLRKARRRQAIDAEVRALCSLVDEVYQNVASLVSARGLCARKAAVLAHLPAAEQDVIGAACQCQRCTAERRLH